MPKSKTTKFKKRVWGCPDPLSSLGSKRNVSKPVVDNVSNVQYFKSSDARRQQDVSNIRNVVTDRFVAVSDGGSQSTDNSNIYTRYFYSTAVDKKCVQGLLARGKKATIVAKQFERPIKVNSRVFVPSLEPKYSTTTRLPCNKVPDRVVPVSVNGVSPPSLVVGQDNDRDAVFVNAAAESRTSGHNNGALITESIVGGENNSHLDDAHNSLYNAIEVSLGDKSVNQGVTTNKLSIVNDNEKPDVVSQVDGQDDCQKILFKANVFGARQSGDTCDNSVRKVLLYDVNSHCCDENVELSNAILLKDGWKRHVPYLEKYCKDFSLWKSQTDYTFGFVPLNNLVLPHSPGHIGDKVTDPVAQHLKIKCSGVPNFLGLRIPIESQLNVPEWKKLFANYWDQQLIHLVEFGFPLDFNRSSKLCHDDKNHSSATDFPTDVQAYLEEEIKHGAIKGPYDVNPIPNAHVSPFMTREKPHAPHRRVIIDLSWPKNASVNAGVDKNSYLGSEFSLTFPTIDDITKELVKIGPGCHIYKIDVSRAFRHLKIDPGDYDLLGVRWDAAFFDTCLPFGSRHGSQNFQRISDAVRYVLRCHGYRVINYIDDFIGYGMPDVAQRSYDCLRDVIERLGLTISEKKLLPPATSAVCLGVLIDTVTGTVAIPDEKMRQIKQSVIEWQTKKTCTKRQLQSLLGQLLYIHKCVRPSRVFLNRMLELLRQNYDATNIKLTQSFRRDLRWFSRFLDKYNGVSMYNHRKIDHVIELDACLDGLGGVWKNLVYHLPIPRHYLGLTIVHLEMVNILVALKVFGPLWATKHVLVKCDNQAVVAVLTHSKTKDPFLATCARNVWLLVALYDLDISYVHIKGKNNVVADLLSRWVPTVENIHKLQSHIPDPLWIKVPNDVLDLDNDI